MEKIKPKEYIDFAKFYSDGMSFVEYINNKTPNMCETEKIIYARRVLNKSILNSFVIIGNVSQDVKNLLNCRQCKLKFSMDNLIKNLLSHPELTQNDYKIIPLIVKNPSKFYKSTNEYDIILFKALNRYYKLVIKTTKNKNENFVKSLHLLNVDRYKKY